MFPIGANVSIDELVEDVVGTGSQGDRQGRPYKDTHGVQPPRLLVRATLAVALQAAPSPYVRTYGGVPRRPLSHLVSSTRLTASS